MLRVLIVMVVFAVCAPAFADGAHERRVTGIYSSLTYNEEGGDLLGMELLIVPREGDDKANYTVVVQIAEGGPPFTAIAPLKVSGDKFEFTLPRDGYDPGAHFTGRFDRNGLVLKEDSGTVGHLKRGKSYWE